MNNVSMSNPAETFCCGPVIAWNQGYGHYLLHFSLLNTNKRMSSFVAQAFQNWSTFKTVPEVLTTLRDRLPGQAFREAEVLIHELIDEGALVSRATLIEKASQVASVSLSPAIEWLTLPTSNRPDAVERAAVSYVANFSQYGHNPNVLISDDSAVSNRDAIRMSLRTLAMSGANVFYADRQNKLSFIERLCEKRDIPKEVAMFTLMGSDAAGLTTGANRNCILLQTIGSRLVSVDDDTTARLCVAPGTQSGLTVAGHAESTDVWSFHNRNESRAFNVEVPIDLIGEHCKYLGRSVGELLAAAEQKGDLDDLANMCSHLIDSVFTAKGHVQMTFNGASGDSGYHSNISLLSHPWSKTRARVQMRDQDYAEVINSRQIVRQAPKATLSHVNSAALGMCMGIDNTSLLPAFLPIGRRQDGVFGALLSRLSEHVYAAHLPFTIDHDPPSHRPYPADPDSEVRLSDVVLGLISTWLPGPTETDTASRLASMGRYFSQVACLSYPDFSELVNVLMCQRATEIIRAIEAVMAEDGYAPGFWVEDLEKRCESLRRSTTQLATLCPVDVGVAAGPAALLETQRIVGRYGEVLEWWPAMREGALALRQEGIVLADRLDPQ